jgi:hypothetical protein
MWFKSSSNSLGLSVIVAEKIKWEQERLGWVDGSERHMKAKTVEEFGDIEKKKKFSCYVSEKSSHLREGMDVWS